MTWRALRKPIATYPEYRLKLGRLAEVLADDPALETPEAETLLDAIAAYMVSGGELEPRPSRTPRLDGE